MRALWAVGFASLLGQAVLLRETLAASSGVELAAVVGLGLWLLGTALGAAAGRALSSPPPGLQRALFFALAGALPASAVAARLFRNIVPGTPGALLPLGQEFLLLTVALLPCGLLSGLIFQRAAQEASARGMPLGRAYAAECGGGLIGGAAATLLPASGAPPLAGVFTAALACALAALDPLPRRAGGRALCLLPAVGLAVALAWSPPLDLALARLAVPGLLATLDTPYARVAVVERQGQVAAFSNGALSHESQGSSAEEFVHPAALFAPPLPRVLILGGAAEGLVTEVLKHGPAEVDCVELDRAGLALALQAAPPGARESLRAPPVTLVIDDPRRFLGGARGRYDLILVALPEPSSAQANRCYTREFFEACAGRLSPAGVFALRLRTPENLWTPLQLLQGGSLWRALGGAFRHRLLLPGGETLFLASASALRRDGESLAARWDALGLETRLLSTPYLRYRVTDGRGPELEAALSAAESPENRDARPVCYVVALQLWLSRHLPALGRTASLPTPSTLAAALLLGAALWLLLCRIARQSTRARSSLLAFGAGLWGMVFEGVVLLAYQANRGVLYQHLGLALALFMAGLALGARVAPPGRGMLWGALFLPALGAPLLAVPAWFGALPAAVLLAASGFLSGGLFAAAARLREDRSLGESSGLLAADLVGGMAGALLGGLLLMPLAGLPATALLLAACAAGAMLLL